MQTFTRLDRNECICVYMYVYSLFYRCADFCFLNFILLKVFKIKIAVNRLAHLQTMSLSVVFTERLSFDSLRSIRRKRRTGSRRKASVGGAEKQSMDFLFPSSHRLNTHQTPDCPVAHQCLNVKQTTRNCWQPNITLLILLTYYSKCFQTFGSKLCIFQYTSFKLIYVNKQHNKISLVYSQTGYGSVFLGSF